MAQRVAMEMGRMQIQQTRARYKTVHLILVKGSQVKRAEYKFCKQQKLVRNTAMGFSWGGGDTNCTNSKN